MSRPASITIHPAALKHNLSVARNTAPGSKVMVAVKADAYGHGMIRTAKTLHELTDGFMVACLSEALMLRDNDIRGEVLVVQGASNSAELPLAAEKDLRLGIHDPYQLKLLDDYDGKKKIKLAIKLDSGMHRLGLPAEDAPLLFTRLKSHPAVDADLWLMSHLACADDLKNSYTRQQISLFNKHTHSLKATKSLANSAGVLGWLGSHLDWIRPGIMIYGSSPLSGHHRDEFPLRPAMTLNAPLIAVHQLKKGNAIGYGSTWTCPRDMTVGVVACGYGDGYPRHAPTGTPIAIKGQISRLLGRVSMDMVVVDLSNIAASVGDLAELWGKTVNVDEVARMAETISYELFCHAGNSCKKF